VFGSYVLVVLPALGFMTYLAIKSFPRLAATTCDSGGRQVALLSRQYAEGDGLGVVTTVLGLILLALPVLGMLYGLFRGARAAVRRLWAWSEDSARKRTLAIISTMTGAAVIVLLWLPQIPFVSSPVSGALYAATANDFTPIGPTERGTVGDAVRAEVVDVPLEAGRAHVAETRATEVALTPTALPRLTRVATAIAPTVVATPSVSTPTPTAAVTAQSASTAAASMTPAPSATAASGALIVPTTPAAALTAVRSATTTPTGPVGQTTTVSPVSTDSAAAPTTTAASAVQPTSSATVPARSPTVNAPTATSVAATPTASAAAESANPTAAPPRVGATANPTATTTSRP
jgi:hypothetical protein